MRFTAYSKNIHPHRDDDGNKVQIHNQHPPTHRNTWDDESKVATFTPGSDSPYMDHKPILRDEKHPEDPPMPETLKRHASGVLLWCVIVVCY